MQFIGRYYHALEQKGRLSIPSTFRNTLGESAIITLGLDGGLFLFAPGEWQKIVEKTNEFAFTRKNARDWIRLLSNNAVEVSFDRLGRILIPEYLREKARLIKDVVVVGSLERIEIWDQKAYHAYLEHIESEAEAIAESLEEKNG
jgi:MraZ protein